MERFQIIVSEAVNYRHKRKGVYWVLYTYTNTPYLCVFMGWLFFLKFMEHIGDGNFGKKVKFRKKSTKQVNLILKWYVDR